MSTPCGKPSPSPQPVKKRQRPEEEAAAAAPQNAAPAALEDAAPAASEDADVMLLESDTVLALALQQQLVIPKQDDDHETHPCAPSQVYDDGVSPVRPRKLATTPAKADEVQGPLGDTFIDEAYLTPAKVGKPGSPESTRMGTPSPPHASSDPYSSSASGTCPAPKLH